jgi:muramoyltetrapeptide carboxypeptidase LdcA involved in peptidoglycan recycling
MDSAKAKDSIEIAFTSKIAELLMSDKINKAKVIMTSIGMKKDLQDKMLKEYQEIKKTATTRQNNNQNKG